MCLVQFVLPDDDVPRDGSPAPRVLVLVKLGVWKVAALIAFVCLPSAWS